MTDPAYSPPWSDDAEASVLGGVFLRPEILPSVPLEVEDFYSPKHQAVFQAMRNLEARCAPIDPMTVVAELERAGRSEAVGGLGFVASLLPRVPSPENVLHYAEIIVGHAQRRRAILAVSTALHRLRTVADVDADDVVAEVIGDLQRVESRKPDPSVPVGVSMRREAGQIHRDMDARERREHVGGMPTGIELLDEKIGGVPFGKLTLVIGETGHGKSTLGQTMLRAAAATGDESLLFSYEDGHQSYAQRAFANESRVPTHRIARRDLRVMDFRSFAAVCNDDTFKRHRERVTTFRGEDVEELCRTVRRLRARGPKHGGSSVGRLVVVDYLQRIPKPWRRGMGVPEAIGEQAAALEALAEREQIAVVLLSQVNDEGQRRDDHRPTGRDVAGSRDPFKICKLCIGIYRPAEYGETDEQGRPYEATYGELLVLKNNQGPLCTVPVRLDLDIHTIRGAA